MLVESVLFQQRDTIRDLVSYNKFSYADDLLIEEKYSGTNSAKDETTAIYKYDDNKKLKAIDVSRGKDELHIVYAYDSFGNIKSKSIQINTQKPFKQLFVLVPYDTSVNNPYNLIQNFEYDNKGYLISTSHYTNGKLILQMIYQLEYY